MNLLCQFSVRCLSLNSKDLASDKGFSLLELVVSVGILLVLTAGGVLAYQQIMITARDAALTVIADELEIALNMYYDDKGHYPKVCFDDSGNHVENPAWTLGCDVSFLEEELRPEYINGTYDTDKINYAVGGRTTQRDDGYGLLLDYERKGRCKVLGGSDPDVNWWAATPKC